MGYSQTISIKYLAAPMRRCDSPCKRNAKLAHWDLYINHYSAVVRHFPAAKSTRIYRNRRRNECSFPHTVFMWMFDVNQPGPTREKVRGAIVHKAGRKYQRD